MANDQGNRITPSYVAFMDNDERLVGDAAKNQATINPENTVFDVKRLIGRNFSDKSVQADKKLVPFDIVIDAKNTLDDDEKADSISAEDKKELQDIVDETLDWMEENPESDKEDYDAKQKEVENIANPIMRNMYAGGEGGGGDEDMGDFGDDEL